jgi:uncharacterized protein
MTLISSRNISCLTFALFSCFGSGGAGATSFDCRRASSPVEKEICSDPQLSDLDEALGHGYATAREYSQNSQAVIERQRAWLSERNACHTNACLVDIYNRRITELLADEQKFFLDQLASEENTSKLQERSHADTNAQSAGKLEATSTLNSSSAAGPSKISAPFPTRAVVSSANPPTMAHSASFLDAWHEYVPRGNDNIESYYGRHPLFVKGLAAYVLIAGLLGLAVVRPPLIDWYRSQIWIMGGSGPVDILFKQIGFRLSFEFFTYALACVFGALGGWLLVVFRPRGIPT